jgi:hypothetical protein
MDNIYSKKEDIVNSSYGDRIFIEEFKKFLSCLSENDVPHEYIKNIKKFINKNLDNKILIYKKFGFFRLFFVNEVCENEDIESELDEFKQFTNLESYSNHKIFLALIMIIELADSIESKGYHTFDAEITYPIFHGVELEDGDAFKINPYENEDDTIY